MLKQRLITACILVCVVLAVIVAFPPLWFYGFMALVLCLGAWEWSRLAGLQHNFGRLLYVAVFLPVLYGLMHVSGEVRNLLLGLSLLWWLLALGWIVVYPRGSQIWNTRAPLLLSGFVVLLPGWLGLLYLRGLDSYILFLLLFLALVAAADIGAYFAGRRFGRRKLAPEVSPNKTWEGFAGGQLAACLVLWIFLLGVSLAGTGLTPIQMISATLGASVLAASSVVGDLFESMVKRQRKVKDSGTLLPGHGGVLDRIDSITAALPVFTFFMLNAGIV